MDIVAWDGLGADKVGKATMAYSVGMADNSRSHPAQMKNAQSAKKNEWLNNLAKLIYYFDGVEDRIIQNIILMPEAILVGKTKKAELICLEQQKQAELV